VLLLDQVERHALAERQVAAIYNAGGNYEPQPLPELHEWRDRFDAALHEEPADVMQMTEADIAQLELRQALGVA
jgi:hypothetical protein